MSRLQINSIIITVFLAAFIAANIKGSGSSASYGDVDLNKWAPVRIGNWTGTNQEAPEVWKSQLPNASFLVRFYDSEKGTMEFLLIESPDPDSFHSPMFCMPGAGWNVEEAGTASLENGTVSKGAFVQDYLKLHVRYWYLAGDKQAATLWQHKWNMFTNKFFRGIDGPNFSYRVTLKQGAAGSEPDTLVNSFTDDMLREVQAIVDSKYKEVAQAR